MGCVKSKNIIRITDANDSIIHKTTTYTSSDIDSKKLNFNKNSKKYLYKLKEGVKNSGYTTDCLTSPKFIKISRADDGKLKKISEESSLEDYKCKNLNSIRISNRENDLENSIVYSENSKKHKNSQQEIKSTLKGIFGQTRFTFAKDTQNQALHNSKESIKANSLNDQKLGYFIRKEKPGSISVQSIYSQSSLLSKKDDKINKIEEIGISEEDEEETTLAYASDNQYQILNLTSKKSNLLKSASSQSIIYNSDQSGIISPRGQSKMVYFLPLNYNVFEKKLPNKLFRKLYLVNLKKTLRQVANYLLTRKNWKTEESFCSSSIKENNYISNFDLLNNHSYELDVVLPQKEFLLPLYQIISNNLEVKITKIFEIKKNQENRVHIINKKYEVLQEISRDEVYNRWVMYHCRKIKDNSLYSIKIIEKKNSPNFSHEYSIEDRMVYCKYTLQIEEIMTSNKYDYLIMEYVDCSLYDYVLKYDFFNENQTDENNNIEMIWKLFRNLVSAIDYCHNVAKTFHRNLNLKNIFVVKDNYVLKITDFACSSYITGNKEYLPQIHVSSTYPPPEYFIDGQNSGESGDIWSMGIILFFMLFKYSPISIQIKPQKFRLFIFNFRIPKMSSNFEIENLLCSLLNFDPEERVSFKELKNNKFITYNMEFPLPDVCSNALDALDFINKLK